MKHYSNSKFYSFKLTKVSKCVLLYVNTFSFFVQVAHSPLRYFMVVSVSIRMISSSMSMVITSLCGRGSIGSCFISMSISMATSPVLLPLGPASCKFNTQTVPISHFYRNSKLFKDVLMIVFLHNS